MFPAFTDAMTVISFLKNFGLDKDFKVIWVMFTYFTMVTMSQDHLGHTYVTMVTFELHLCVNVAFVAIVIFKVVKVIAQVCPKRGKEKNVKTCN